MNEFLSFYDKIKHGRGWRLEICHSSCTDWSIDIIQKKDSRRIITIQDCDMELCFAKAQVSLKEWLSENEGGY